MEESLSGTLAIDLGNTNTVVAFQDQKDINSVLVEIPNITSSPGVIPSAVWFEEPSKITKIGISALKMRDNSNSDLFFHSNFKRLIGNSIEKINQKNILNPNECGEKFFTIRCILQFIRPFQNINYKKNLIDSIFFIWGKV